MPRSTREGSGASGQHRSDSAGVEGPFADPYFAQWDALEMAFDQFGHTTQTFQGERAWLLALRDGLDDRTTPATRHRYRKILTAVQRLYGRPCYMRSYPLMKPTSSVQGRMPSNGTGPHTSQLSPPREEP